MALLEVRNLSKSFRGLRAVHEISFDVEPREIVALIGPNGAGKTTCFNLIAGAIPPDRGQIRLDGRDITGQRPHVICHAGIGRTFQIVKPFIALTVEENVAIGALNRTSDMAQARKEARHILEFLGLDGKRSSAAGALTLPECKRLEIARAIATKPRLLLLDEVMAGLRPTETDHLVAIFRRLPTEMGISILLTEHVMRAVMALASRLVVLHHGEEIASGSPGEIVNHPAVLESYLGTDEL